MDHKVCEKELRPHFGSKSGKKQKSLLQKLTGSKAKEQYQLYLIMAPVLIHIFIFCYVPLYGILIAFQNYAPGAPFLAFDGSVQWVGLKWFREFITGRYFWRLMRNTVVMSLMNLVLGFPLPIIFALLLNEVKFPRYKKFVQTASYLPHCLSVVVVAGMVLSFVDTQGIINNVRAAVGMAPISFSVDPDYFWAIYTITSIWKSFGWNSILYLSAMSSIDICLYEAARLDGANRFKQMLYVTLPGILPTISLMLIFAVGGILSSNTELILLLYNPATYEKADVIGTYVYRDGLQGGRFSFGSAVGVFTNVINFALVYGANLFARKFGGNSVW
ncbi:MAG: ABC transporter permease subunit [Firmicutes bacterium]|nr:ABC transporter permease subunit [Bacillota bacterium]